MKGLLYPVPNPDFPFLGVHCACMINGVVQSASNGVLVFKRADYRRTDFDLGILGYSGFGNSLCNIWEKVCTK